jgi:hypothetical protein
MRMTHGACFFLRKVENAPRACCQFFEHEPESPE